MTAKQKIQQVRLDEWTTRFADQKASGLSVRNWCSQSGYSVHQYYYWKRLLTDKVVDSVFPDIVPLQAPDVISQDVPTVSQSELLPTSNRTSCTTRPTCATLTVDGMTIDLTSDATEEFLYALLKAVCHA